MNSLNCCGFEILHILLALYNVPNQYKPECQMFVCVKWHRQMCWHVWIMRTLNQIILIQAMNRSKSHL